MADKVNLTEEVIIDLSSLAMDRCQVVMTDVLNLIDDHHQKMVVCTNVAALMFGLASRFLQHHVREADGEMLDFEKAINATTYYVAKLALEDPPEPYTPGRVLLASRRND